LLADLIRGLLPVIERTGVATAHQVDVETLETRLAEELAAADAVFAPSPLLSAWGTTG
jgi:hypothetical protein